MLILAWATTQSLVMINNKKRFTKIKMNTVPIFIRDARLAPELNFNSDLDGHDQQHEKIYKDQDEHCANFYPRCQAHT